MLNCKKAIQSVEACPLTDPDPASGRPPPAASAASDAHATGASYEPASATAASATGGRESYALAELGFVFFVEDIKCSKSDIRNFLLIEADFGTRYVV